MKPQKVLEVQYLIYLMFQSINLLTQKLLESQKANDKMFLVHPDLQKTHKRSITE